MTKTEEEIAGGQDLPIGFVGKQRKSHGQQNQHDQAGGLQRNIVPGKQNQRHEDENHHRQRVHVGECKFQHSLFLSVTWSFCDRLLASRSQAGIFSDGWPL